MTSDPQISYIAETALLARNIQSAFFELAGRLVKIKGEGLWQGRFNSYEDFLEDIQITKSMDSKLRTVYFRFKEVSPVKLAKVGISKLYAIASRVEDDTKALALVEEAQEMTRGDLQDSIREETYGVHEHKGEEITFLVCSECGKWQRKYE